MNVPGVLEISSYSATNLLPYTANPPTQNIKSQLPNMGTLCLNRQKVIKNVSRVLLIVPTPMAQV